MVKTINYKTKIDNIMNTFRFLMGSVADTVLAKVCMKVQIFPKDIKTESNYKRFLSVMQEEFSLIVGEPVVKRVINENK